MKTYFMAWESDNKRGQSITEFKKDFSSGDEIMPKKAFIKMLSEVKTELSKTNSKGLVTATQFNLVE